MGPVYGAFTRNYIIWDGFTTNENDHSYYDGEPHLATAWDSTYIEFRNAIFIGHVNTYTLADRNRSAIRFEAARNCRVYNSSFTHFLGTDENNAAIYLYDNADILVENNYFYQCYNSLWAKGSWAARNNDRTIFRYNWVESASELGIRIGYIARSCRIYQNVFVNMKFGMELTATADYVGRSDDNIFANNTLYNLSQFGLKVHGNANDYGTFYNNIVVSGTLGASGSYHDSAPGVHVFDYNVYYNNTNQWYGGGTQTWSYWQSTWGKDAHGQVANPNFVSAGTKDFRLQAGSPALTAGRDILDLDGDGSTTDTIPAGAYITGNEVIGISSGPDTTAPTVTSASIGTNGTTITVNFSETVVTTGYDNGDFDLDCATAGSGISLNSISGSGSSRTFTAAVQIGYGDVCNLDYIGGADEIEDSAGNDLAAFSNLAVTNNVPAPDGTPNQFTFTDVTGASRSTVYTSNTITVAGINQSVAVSITGGTYSKNGGTYTSSAGTAVLGDTFAVRQTSSASYSTTTNTVLTIGGVSDTYSVTTIAESGDVISPVCTITSPTSNSTYSTSSSTINMAGSASDAVGVTSVTWANDRGGSGVCTGTTSWSKTGITLYSGVNVITITAFDAANNQGTDVLTVTYTEGGSGVETGNTLKGVILRGVRR
jgi:hypothetical protein